MNTRNKTIKIKKSNHDCRYLKIGSKTLYIDWSIPTEMIVSFWEESSPMEKTKTHVFKIKNRK